MAIVTVGAQEMVGGLSVNSHETSPEARVEIEISIGGQA